MYCVCLLSSLSGGVLVDVSSGVVCGEWSLGVSVASCLFSMEGGGMGRESVQLVTGGE